LQVTPEQGDSERAGSSAISGQRGRRHVRASRATAPTSRTTTWACLGRRQCVASKPRRGPPVCHLVSLARSTRKMLRWRMLWS